MADFSDSQNIFKINFDHLSGASELLVWGTPTGKLLSTNVSGASLLNTYNLEFENATVIASGASKARVSVSKYLDADASGASYIYYQGSPVVNVKNTGASIVGKE